MSTNSTKKNSEAGEPPPYRVFPSTPTVPSQQGRPWPTGDGLLPFVASSVLKRVSVLEKALVFESKSFLYRDAGAISIACLWLMGGTATFTQTQQQR